MTNQQHIQKLNTDALAGFLQRIEGEAGPPWDLAYEAKVCSACTRTGCSPACAAGACAWWLKQER